jgi:hypothetical protein
MESVIKALLDQGVSADQFLSFATDYGIQDESYIQEVLNQLVAKETNPTTPRAWTPNDADNLLELLKSPEKTPNRPVL